MTSNVLLSQLPFSRWFLLILYVFRPFQTPRPEAVSVLTTLLSFSGIVENFPSFKKTPNIGNDLKVSFVNRTPGLCPPSLLETSLFQLRIVNALLHTAKKEQSGLARCVALSGLGIYLIQEFEKGSKHTSLNEAFNVILLALKVSGLIFYIHSSCSSHIKTILCFQFNHEIVAQVACDILFLICDYVNILSERYPELLPRTIEVGHNYID